MQVVLTAFFRVSPGQLSVVTNLKAGSGESSRKRERLGSLTTKQLPDHNGLGRLQSSYSKDERTTT